MRSRLALAFLGVTVALATVPARAQSPQAQNAAKADGTDGKKDASDIAGRLGLKGHVILETRLRNEYVRQEGLDDATALTFAARFGYEIEPVKRLSLLVEGEGVAQLTNTYSDTVRTVPGRPIVADPEDIQLNRFQARYAFADAGSATLGRQRIVYDDARFVGNVGFRQNEQTFDAASFDWKAGDALRLRYAYIDRVNRIFGGQIAAGVFKSDSHIAQTDWQTATLGQISLFVTALDFQNSPANAQLTYGLRWNKPFKSGGWRARLEFDGARQEVYRGGTAPFDVYYGKAKATIGTGEIDVALSGEWLQGDGGASFQTPLATLHAFQGFADVFLRTPPEGLRDVNLGLLWKPRAFPVGDGFSLLMRGHIFTDDEGGSLLGREFDALARLPLKKWLAVELKGAVFDGADARFASRTRLWFAVETRF